MLGKAGYHKPWGDSSCADGRQFSAPNAPRLLIPSVEGLQGHTRCGGITAFAGQARRAAAVRARRARVIPKRSMRGVETSLLNL